MIFKNFVLKYNSHSNDNFNIRKLAPSTFVSSVKTLNLFFLVQVYRFPKRVVDLGAKFGANGPSSLLNDIVVDVDTQIGYISNSGQGQLVVYDSRASKSWTVQKKPEMFANNLKVRGCVHSTSAA